MSSGKYCRQWRRCAATWGDEHGQLAMLRSRSLARIWLPAHGVVAARRGLTRGDIKSQPLSNLKHVASLARIGQDHSPVTTKGLVAWSCT